MLCRWQTNEDLPLEAAPAGAAEGEDAPLPEAVQLPLPPLAEPVPEPEPEPAPEPAPAGDDLISFD